jgi:Tfp pilus assembly protein PilV
VKSKVKAKSSNRGIFFWKRGWNSRTVQRKKSKKYQKQWKEDGDDEEETGKCNIAEQVCSNVLSRCRVKKCKKQNRERQAVGYHCEEKQEARRESENSRVKRTPSLLPWIGKEHRWSVESNQNHCGGPMGAGYPEAGAVAAAELEGREPTGPCVDDNDDADTLPLLALTTSMEIEADRLALVW